VRLKAVSYDDDAHRSLSVLAGVAQVSREARPDVGPYAPIRRPSSAPPRTCDDPIAPQAADVDKTQSARAAFRDYRDDW
jgi:hypothetical protein